MNYAEQLKQKETLVNNLKTNALAKKQFVEEQIEKRKKAEEECQKLFKISLSDVGDKLKSLEKELDDLFNGISSEVEAIGKSLKSIE